MNIFKNITIILILVLGISIVNWIGVTQWQNSRNEAIELRQQVHIERVRLKQQQVEADKQEVELESTIKMRELTIELYKDSIDSILELNRDARKTTRQSARQQRRLARHTN